MVQLLGTGGTALVYLGVHAQIDSQAAIKLLHTHFATPDELASFRTEAQIIATLQHLHIVRLLDCGVEAGTPYLVLDYASNGWLRQRFPPAARCSQRRSCLLSSRRRESLCLSAQIAH